jgi:hypothetical protein
MNAYLAPKAPRSNRASSFAAGAALAALIGLTLLVTTGCGGTAGDQGICFEACEHENACLGLSLDCKAPESNGTCSDASIQCNASCVASATCADLVGAQTMSSGLENGFIACNSACPHIE